MSVTLLFIPIILFIFTDTLFGYTNSMFFGDGYYVDEIKIIFDTNLLFDERPFGFKRGIFLSAKSMKEAILN